ncbi:hypothetical protein B0T22DRAFT_271386 [Podospora appendiculata]|uniref:Zn(2)-C6 fungal-type domain-containing protein n=1 Tax=Podospora appendiculata TaxID=314037 RepID=A0AAE1C9J0_9PEZI|nr:hypothetical protein B0T22DRAFT_271386 [Podospora appendiculata]
MVYGGKPSRGCRTCRTRRIKCDEAKPTCKRCEKSKRECLGYRPEFEIVHRDQNRSTVRRMRRAVSQQRQQQQQQYEDESQSLSYLLTPSHSPPPHLFQSSSRQTLSPSPVPAPTTPIGQRATCHFASNFILVPLDGHAHGFMDYLVPLLGAEPPESALSYAFSSCALALLGNRSRADNVDLAKRSLKEHTLALARTHAALGDPATATADATLAAVMMLCLYESITAVKESRMLAWRSHIMGALQIVKSRGREEMYRTKTGTILFNAVRHQLISRTLSAGIPPPLGVDWWMQGGDTDSLPAVCQLFSLKTGELRAEVAHLLTGISRTAESIEILLEMSQRVRSLDHDIATWLASIPPESCPRTLCWMWDDEIDLSQGTKSYSEVAVFPGRVDIYPDLVTANTWNIARVARLLLASLSIRITGWVSSPMGYHNTTEYTTSQRISEGAITDIIASIPYHLGWHTKQHMRGMSHDSNSEHSGFACGEDAPTKALPGLFLIWSLTCIKNFDLSTEEQRAWAKGRLRFIEEQVGLKYARIVNDVDFRFPSMMIRQDRLKEGLDPLKGHSSGLPLRLKVVLQTPMTPESLDYVERSPSPE